jgi:hypothetical protein
MFRSIAHAVTLSDAIPCTVFAEGQTATVNVFLAADNEWPVLEESSRRSESTEKAIDSWS